MLLFLWAYFSLERQCGVLRGALAQVIARLDMTGKVANEAVTTAKHAWDLASDAKGKPRFFTHPNGKIGAVVPKFPNVESLNDALEELRDELRTHGVQVDEWDKVAGRRE